MRALAAQHAPGRPRHHAALTASAHASAAVSGIIRPLSSSEVTMKRSFGLSSLGILLLAGSLSAQAPAGAAPGAGRAGGAPQPPPTNLQVLPKDIARPELIAMMGQFRQAL